MGKEIDEAAVWRRVTAAAEESPPTGATGELLLEALRAGATLGKMYGRLRGREIYRRMQDQQQQENLQLRGLWLLQRGTPPELGTCSLPRQTEAPLPWLLEQQRLQWQRLGQLAAGATGPERELLERLARQAGNRWGQLVGELGRST